MRETYQEEPKSENIINNFNNIEIPLKIKKIKILETVGLPISQMDFLKRDDIGDLPALLSEKLKLSDGPLIVRSACVPDKFSMPTFYLEKEMSEIDKIKIIEEIYSLVNNDQTIKYLIIQDATPSHSAKDKISGRILFEKSDMAPIQEILEIYKGARSTGVLNNVNTEDPNFQIFIKKAGEFMKPTKKLSADSSIKEGEIRDIYRFLVQYRDKIDTAIDMIANRPNKDPKDTPISFEFSYRDGKIVFSDIDY